MTSGNANAGSTASAILAVTVTPTRLVYTTVPPTPITAGSIMVAFEDGSGNVAINNSSASVTLVVTGPAGYSQTFAATAINGVVTFNLSSVALTAFGSYTYTASATGLASGTTTETVNPGAFATLIVLTQSSFSAPGQTGSAIVRAVDNDDNTGTSFTGTVTLTSNDPLATLPAAYTYTASDAGTHTFTYSFGTTGSARTLTAATSGSTITQSNITVNDCILFINSNGTLSPCCSYLPSPPFSRRAPRRLTAAASIAQTPSPPSAACRPGPPRPGPTPPKQQDPNTFKFGNRGCICLRSPVPASCALRRQRSFFLWLCSPAAAQVRIPPRPPPALPSRAACGNGPDAPCSRSQRGSRRRRGSER